MFTYCPACGQKTVVHHNPTDMSCTSCSKQFWNNPRATVGIIFVRDGKILFSKRAIEPEKGLYDFPGGFLEYNEDVYDACVREVKEETSVDLDPACLTFIGVYTLEYLPGTSVVDMLFITSEWKGDFTPSDDSEALEWHPISFLEDSRFAPDYYGLENKITAYLAA